MNCRSPHGERGLKFDVVPETYGDVSSLPPRGAWIEIGVGSFDYLGNGVAPPTGSVD